MAYFLGEKPRKKAVVLTSLVTVLLLKLVARLVINSRRNTCKTKNNTQLMLHFYDFLYEFLKYNLGFGMSVYRNSGVQIIQRFSGYEAFRFFFRQPPLKSS